MKSIFLAFLLMLSPVWADQSTTVGSLLDINGTIAYVNSEKGTITIGTTDYVMDRMSVITVNGNRATIQDLAPGMKVTGSGEITASSNRLMPVKTLRMLHATGAPADAQSTPGVPNPQTSVPQMPPQGAPGGPPGDPNAAATNPAALDLKQKLGGTFWMLSPGRPVMAGNPGNRPQAPNPDLWFSLNADGTTTCGWMAAAGRWRINNQLFVVVIFDPTQPGGTLIRFDPELTVGRIAGSNMGAMPFGNMRMPLAFFMATRINPPTQAMLAKVPAAPTPLAAATPTPAPVAAETQNAAAEAVRANSNNLVFVTGKEGAGSGFIASLNGANYLFTNAHVAAGINDANFKTLGGTVVKGDAASVAVGHDIFCSALPAGGKPFEIMQGVDENAKIGDDVVVLGNAEGSGVINTIIGKIVGVGPDLVEIDAQFVPGNSGSPIIHLKTGKVIGVATYTVTRKYDATTHEKMATPQIRRYGYRIDSVKTWQAVNWRTFYAEADAMEKVHALTGDLDGFFRDIAETHGKVTVERHTNPVIKSRISEWLDEKGNRSRIDRANADASFLSFLKIACQSDISALRGRLTYDYFQRELVTEQETRTEMSKAFSEIIEDIRK